MRRTRKPWGAFIRREAGWLPAWLALSAGSVAVEGLPSGFSPLALIAGLTLFLLLLPGRSSRRGAWLGFLFGLGHFGWGFSWLLTSLYAYGGLSLEISVAMLLGLAAVMALYPALFGALLPRLLSTHRVWSLPLAAPALWTITEWLRAHVLTGFSWNLAGYGWSTWQPFLQIADLGGIYLLSWLMVWSASMLAVGWLHRSAWRKVIGVFVTLAITLGATAQYGIWRLDTLASPSDQTAPPAIRVAIVQGNVEQQLKWLPAHQGKTVERYLALSRTLPPALDLVVWPETAMPFFLHAYPEHLAQISQLIREALQAPVLTGAPMMDQTAQGQAYYYNSMLLLDGSGSLHRRYNKHHLVPFGEFIPFRRWVPNTFKKFTEGTADFSAGEGAMPILWEKGDIGPLICYEAIFPDEVRALALTDVAWLVNITNDGWFGESAKPQHLAMVRVRAIENRLPMIRAANTGISAVFDQAGRELGRIAPNRPGTLVVTLPQGQGESFYRRSAPYWIAVWVGLILLSWVVTRRDAALLEEQHRVDGARAVRYPRFPRFSTTSLSSSSTIPWISQREYPPMAEQKKRGLRPHPPGPIKGIIPLDPRE